MSVEVIGIEEVLDRLDDFTEPKLKEKGRKICGEMAYVGARSAAKGFNEASYDDGDRNISVYAEATKDGYTVNAEGDGVTFIEFGAGVYYNGSEPYPIRRPAGIAKIGEYGKKHGRRKAWGYYDKSGNLVVTHGTPAAMPMYHAGQDMLRELPAIAKEVFDE